MYERIKQLADEAVALQNKTRMEEVLREISGMCAHARRPLDLGEYEYGFPPAKMTAEQFEAAELAQHQAARYSGPEHGPITKAILKEGEAQMVAERRAAKRAKKEAK